MGNAIRSVVADTPARAACFGRELVLATSWMQQGTRRKIANPAALARASAPPSPPSSRPLQARAGNPGHGRHAAPLCERVNSAARRARHAENPHAEILADACANRRVPNATATRAPRRDTARKLVPRRHAALSGGIVDREGATDTRKPRYADRARALGPKKTRGAEKNPVLRCLDGHRSCGELKSAVYLGRSWVQQGSRRKLVLLEDPKCSET